MIETTYLEWERNRTMDSDFPVALMPCLEQFFKTEHLLPPGRSVYQEVFDTDLLFPLQRQQEMDQMMTIARSINPRVVYEIGADKGGGLYHWCKSLPSVERVIACEIRGTPYKSLFEKAFPEIEFLWLEASSYDPQIVATVKTWFNGDKIDSMFIDGDKTAFHKDFDAYLPLMDKLGIVFMHDIQDDCPGASYRAVCDRGYRHLEVINLEDTDRAIEREGLDIPAATPHEGWLRHWRGASCGVGVIYLSGGNRGAV